MSEYSLSAILQEHDDDVRSTIFPSPVSVFSASRDATVRVWSRLSSKPPKFDCTISSHSQSFVNAVAYVTPSSDYPKGLIVSGGKDTIIDVRQPGKPPETDAERLLLGHAHNVCALDVSVDGRFIVSGSWDGTARIWSMSSWECEALLEGHNGSVWTVLAYDKKTVITGCADQTIRFFDPRGKQYGVARGSTDVVRALCRVSSGHTSGAEFASAGNDSVIRLWKLNGSQVGELRGHESFIYSLAALASGELVSSGEDRTVRIWRGSDCIQTITHPAISVWSVAVCAENGDIVSGASDKIVRIFTRDKERQAAPETIKTFEDSVKASAIPQQQVGDLNKEKLPGPDFLQKKSGTKEGQVQMIQEPNGSVSAHQWSQAAQSWMNVGTVVDSAGSSGRKASYGGKDYDFVFDVDIEDGKPPLKLPYNLSQTPYEAATKFLEDNELPMTYLDQVAGFITTNSQGATMGQAQAPVGADPWGTEARYRPGGSSTQPLVPAQASASRSKVLPQRGFLAITTANLQTILKKINEFNEQLKQDGSEESACDKNSLSGLDAARLPLESALASKPSDDKAIVSTVPTILKMLSTWPPALRLPVLDFARLLTAASSEIFSANQAADFVKVLLSSGFEDKDRENNIMLATRGLGNCFETQAGRDRIASNLDDIHVHLRGYIQSTNRNLLIAIATVYLNCAVMLGTLAKGGSQTASDQALSLIEDCIDLAKNANDSEALYRSLVAIGTFVKISEEVSMAAKEIFGLENALQRAESKLNEPRLKGLIAEIRDGLKG